jgi:membrane protease YdiL (CAAX protease family)
MIPNDPESSTESSKAPPAAIHQSLPPADPPVQTPPAFIQQSPLAGEPFWDYFDVLLFLLLGGASLALSLLASAAFTRLNIPFRLLLAQTLWYGLAFGALKLLFLVRYDRPFWQSLAWRPIALGTALGAILAGPALLLAIGLIGSALRTPQIETPFDQLLGSRGTIIFFGILAVILGPVAEELAFRGFLMPLLMRSLGTAAGIVLTGIIFGSIHGYEYRWSWQYMLLISVVGSVFGWARYKTKSTLASALMHSTFNLTQFVALVWHTRTI